jgi:lipopolysaccharide/colanic/teichoic acid biosynthesis glycosyltransferase
MRPSYRIDEAVPAGPVAVPPIGLDRPQAMVAPATDAAAAYGRLGLEASLGPKHGAYVVAKSVFEWFVALAMLIFAAPLIGVLAIMVKRGSPGPAFYKQQRLGKNGKLYWIRKLRTMRQDAEAKSGAVWARKNDSRITPIGNFLRNSHLDELPQLWNVICGQMTLIGPRPERPELVAKIVRVLPDYPKRVMVKPGVTGLAQMRLPADEDMQGLRKKLAHDLYYVRHVSLLLDLRISISTGFYFLGAVCNALCGAMVKSHGKEVEQEYDSVQYLEDDEAVAQETAA